MSVLDFISRTITPEREKRYSPVYSRQVVLFAGGTDPSGGAGLAADVRTASLIGVHPAIAVTAVTVQETGRMLDWRGLEPSLVRDQIGSVAGDGPVGAVKTGMLASPAIVDAVARAIGDFLPGVPLVCDPVLRAGSGRSLGTDDLAASIAGLLLPASALFTPNTEEASVITGIPVEDPAGMERAGEAMLGMGAGAVLVKGGHLPGPPADLLVTRDGSRWFHGPRIPGGNVHGTGCTLSAGIASLIASGLALGDAVAGARLLVRRGIGRRWARGSGFQLGLVPQAGPVPAGADEVSWYLPPAFCVRCGGELRSVSGGESHLACPECGAVHYRNPLPAVALMVHDGSRLLLVRRAKPPAEGFLCLPGGFMELGETVEECGRRELLEETGIEMGSWRLFGTETDTTVYGGVVLTALEVTSWRGEPRPGDDASEVVWTDMGSVPDLAFEAHRRLVSALGGRAGAPG
jgi:hydroxymethylpyrimidine/phosphomethylpyrimidine kinase